MVQNKSLLSDSDNDDSSNEAELKNIKINKKFAKEYETQQKTIDLVRAKGIFLSEKDHQEDDSDSESESEDEDAEQLSTKLDIQIINTINSLRKKDPLIYDTKKKWFEDGDLAIVNTTVDSSSGNMKKKTFKDVIREQILSSESGDIVHKDDDKINSNRTRNLFEYNEEQQKIRQSFINSGHVESDDDDVDDVLQVKQKSKKELKEEEIELKKVLNEMKELRNTSSSSSNVTAAKIQTGTTTTSLIDTENSDEFLEHYIEKSLWKEKNYSLAVATNVDEEDEEEEFVEEMERFESKYNFRFEELEDVAVKNKKLSGGGGGEYGDEDDKMGQPSSSQVMGHARNIDGSLRRVDDKRKIQRELKKEKKDKERRQQEAELRRLKNLKRAELKDRLKKIAQMSGLHDDITLNGLNEEFLDDDWDPEKHEALMAAQFNDDYYNQDDSALFPEGGEYEEDYLNYYDNIHSNEDTDMYENIDIEANGVENEFTSSHQSISKQAAAMTDELYQLDYEDIVAGLPCRFKYKSVEPDDFGLTTEDILLAEDSELNKYVSLKKLSAYNNTNKKMNNNSSNIATVYGHNDDRDLSKKRKRLRANLKERLAREAEEAIAAGLQLKGTKQQVNVNHESGNNDDYSTNMITTEDPKKRKRKRKKTRNLEEENGDMSANNIRNNTTNNVNSAMQIAIVPPPSISSIQEVKQVSKHKQKKSKKEEKPESSLIKRLNLYT